MVSAAKIKKAASEEKLYCAYCGGRLKEEKGLRGGYEKFKDDRDAYGYYFVCVCCAGTTGWSKTRSGAVRLAQMRPLQEKESK